MSPARQQGARKTAAGARAASPAAAAPAGALVSSGPEANPALALCSTLGLLVLFLLPLFGGGYSGGGFQLSFVLLPLALAAGLWVSRSIPRPALNVLALYLLGLCLLPFWLAPGQLLWYYIAQIPLGWCWAWVLLNESPTRARWLMPAVALSGLLTVLYGAFLWFGAGTLDYQLSSSFGLHNPYGGYLLLAWPSALICAAGSRSSFGRVAWSALTLLLIAALVLTHSQGCIASLALQAVLLGLWLLLRPGQRAGSVAARAALRPLPLLIGALVLLAGLLALAPVRDTLAQIFDFGGYSMQGRLRFWGAALEIFSSHLLSPGGPGSFAYMYPQVQKDWVYYSVDPHSWELQLLAELGIYGALVLLSILSGVILWLRRLWQGPANPLLSGLCAVAVLGSLAHASIDFDYTFSAVTMLLGALLAYGSFHSRGIVSAGTLAAEGPAPLAAPLAAPPLPEAAPATAAPSIQPSPRWLAWLCILLLLGAAYWGQRLSLERFVLDTLRGYNVGEIMANSLSDSAGAQAAARREELLRSAIRYNPHNFQTRYLLAYPMALGAAPASRAESLAQAEKATDLNPRFTQAWVLRGLLAGEQQQKDEFMGKAIELDPYNFPEHYFYWAQLAPGPEEHRERLLLGMQRIPANDPIPPEHVRPQWHGLNTLFGQWWEELARLTDDPQQKRLYEERAKKFKDYVIAEREKKLQQSN